MSIDHINVEEAIRHVQELMEKEKSSPAMKAALNTILLLVQILINRLGLNGKNSSTPPSQDPNRAKQKREKSVNKPGGQKGREGKTLERVENPDEVIPLSIDPSTLPEGKYTPGRDEVRQVFDIEIKGVVTEYRAEVLIDQNGKKFVAPFPSGLDQSVQYGSGVKAHAVYLSQYQLLPYERIREYFEDQLGFPISPGSIINWNTGAYKKLEPFEHILKERLFESHRLHSDETSININGGKQWLHVLSNDEWTYLLLHPKRGREAMDEMGVLPQYTGILAHDHWKPYYQYTNITHSLCNAHHLRELERVCETEEEHEWAKKMQTFLLELNKKVIESGGEMEKQEQKHVRKQYREILVGGDKECPPPPEKKPDTNGKKKRGRQKKSRARNLLERLRGFEDDVLRFMTHKNIPFTNNLGERDLRMTKVQQKISGCFRSEEGGKTFARIRSYLGSAKKQNFSPTFALQSLFLGINIWDKEEGGE